MKQDGTCRVLVVEAHPVTREVLRRLLRACGCDALAVDTAAGAEAELDTVDWVFLDLHLPDGGVLELLRSIRCRGLPVKVAVTVATPSADRATMTRALKLGADAVFPKPVEFARLSAWARAA